MQKLLMSQMLLIQALLVISCFAEVALVGLPTLDNGKVLSRKEVGDAQCDNCRKFMGKFYQAIEVNLKEIKPEVIKIIEKTCQEAKQDASICKDAIDDFPDFMIKQFRLLLNPYGFCPAADYCKSNGSTHHTTEVDDCMQCQSFFAGVRQKLIKNNQVDVAVSQHFREACDSLCSLSLFCYEMVEQFFPAMLKKVATLVPDDLTGCTDLGYCKTSTQKRQQPKGLITKLLQDPSITVAQPDGPPTCSNCQEFMGRLYINIEGSVKLLTPVIANAASRVCNSAGNLTNLCRDALKDFPDVVVPDIITLMNPYFFCPETKYCTSSENKVDSSNITDTEKCTQCKSFFTDVYQRLGKDINIDVAISKQLEKTCAGFCSLAVYCKQAVESFVPGMIQNTPASLPQATDSCISLKYCTAVDTLLVQ